MDFDKIIGGPPMAAQKYSIALTLISCALATTALSQAAQDSSDRSTLTIDMPLNRFTDNLFTTINLAAKGQNVVVSPISMHVALSAVLLGAGESSTTKMELMNVLGLQNESQLQQYHEDYSKLLTKFKELTAKRTKQIKVAEQATEFGSNPEPIEPVIDMLTMLITKNRAAAQPGYRSALKKYYHGLVENVNDMRPQSKKAVLARLNKWAKEADFEQSIITESSLNSNFEANLLTAARVQAHWPDKFHESDGKFYNFGLEDSAVVGKTLAMSDVEGAKYLELTDYTRARYKRLNMRMTKVTSEFAPLTALNAQMVQIPLEGGLSYTIIEPLAYSTPSDNKLSKLVKELFEPAHVAAAGNASAKSANVTRESKLVRVLQLLDDSGDLQGLDLVMPKFKFESDHGMSTILNYMGLRRAFIRGASELSNITMNRLHIDEVTHQAVIDVNAKGIKAVGVTKIQFSTTSLELSDAEPTYAVIERPFVFVIRYGKIPLFVGQLTNL